MSLYELIYTFMIGMSFSFVIDRLTSGLLRLEKMPFNELIKLVIIITTVQFWWAVL